DEIFNSIVVLENVKVKAELFCFGTMIMKNSILDIGSIENFRVSIDVNSEIIFTECSNLDLITTDKSKKIIKKI
ncbi:MAG: hypothetical protein QXG00_08450, partial [Candidatus Woesearchaeota archaeon]